MEQTFITIHNLTPDANILFVSDSIENILGYQPRQVLGRSCFEYFHPDEVPFARSVHNRGVLLDKAAVLHYCRILSQDGQWISCECCFTIVHDVLVASTSIYRRGQKSERRAIEAPQIRRIFSSSPRDPRYHMLEHLSPKFKMPPMEREPRAALILNRFTRSLTVMYATNAVSSILGVSPDEVQGKSFYECIAENCTAEAIKCLESAKANDSIAYLRFWCRDPRREGEFERQGQDSGDAFGGNSNSNSPAGGANLQTEMDIDSSEDAGGPVKKEEPMSSPTLSSIPTFESSSRPEASSSSQAGAGPGAPSSSSRSGRLGRLDPGTPRELEAVVSCTSDGLVVVLRRARPPIPALHPPLLPMNFENGLFAAPWSPDPISPYSPSELFYTFRPPLLPQYMPLRPHIKAAGGPPIDQLMRSIRDVAVFAWGLVGINPSLAQYGNGVPRNEAQPPEQKRAWDHDSRPSLFAGGDQASPPGWPSRATEGYNHRLGNPSPGTPHGFGPSTDATQAYHDPFRGYSGLHPNHMGEGHSGWPASTCGPSSTVPEAGAGYLNPPPQQQQQQNLPGMAFDNQRPQEPWAEASASYLHQGANFQAPTTQPPGYDESRRGGYPYYWQ